MRPWPLILVITALLAGCERSVKRDMAVAPTPGAVECARRAAIQHGYQPSDYRRSPRR